MSGSWITEQKIRVTILPRHHDATASSTGAGFFVSCGSGFRKETAKETARLIWIIR